MGLCLHAKVRGGREYMFSVLNKLMSDQRKGEKITRYSIKKYCLGVASVAVAFGVYFINGSVVAAQETIEASSLPTTSNVTVIPEDVVVDSLITAPSSQKSTSGTSQSQKADKNIDDTVSPTSKIEVPDEVPKTDKLTSFYDVKSDLKSSPTSMASPSSQNLSILQETAFFDREAASTSPRNDLTESGGGTYTPSVVRATLTSANVVSTGIQGQTQKATLIFKLGDATVPIDIDRPMAFENGQTKKTVLGVGEYSIAPDGTITFTPEKKYSGTPDSVIVKRVDKNGTLLTATYTPSVTKVTPTSINAYSRGFEGQPQSGKPVFIPGNPAVPIDYDIPMTFEDGKTIKSVPDVGEYLINSDGSITFTSVRYYIGYPDPVSVRRLDKNGTEVFATYSPSVMPVMPVIPYSLSARSTDLQGRRQFGTPEFFAGDPSFPIDYGVPMTFEDGKMVKSVPGIGEYSINGDTITFVPEKQYTGTPTPVTVMRVDSLKSVVTATYTPTVIPLPNTSSKGFQGRHQSAFLTFIRNNTILPIDRKSTVSFDNGLGHKVVPGVGVYYFNPNTSIVFIPNKDYYGTPDPVVVKRIDERGEYDFASYTPTVLRVVPSSTSITSTGPQGLPQFGTPLFFPGNELVPINYSVPMTFEDGKTTKLIPGVGEYTINQKEITFVPDKKYFGTPNPIKVRRVDENGTPVIATYTPTVTKVTPTSIPSSTTGPQGVEQYTLLNFIPGNPEVPIDYDAPMSFENGKTIKLVPGVGIYSISYGGITFTPDKKYFGTPDPVTVKWVDKNGTEVTTTYTPSVSRVTPTSMSATSKGLQGQPQTAFLDFIPGDSKVPIDWRIPMVFEDGTSNKKVPGVGEYSLLPYANVSIAFTPDKQFFGTPAPVRVKRVDVNGTPVTADYQVEVTRVTPTSTSVTSTGIQGQLQFGTPVFKEGAPEVPMDNTVPMTFEDGSMTKFVPGVGVYSINQDAFITFTPDKQFSGLPAPVTVKRVDKNGTPVTADYQVEVTRVTPTSISATSIGAQGYKQSGTPVFFPGDSAVPINYTVAMTFENGTITKSLIHEGVYTITSEGVVEFEPDKTFSGQGSLITVKRVDKNGTIVTATYQATVVPIKISPMNNHSSGVVNQPQTGRVLFLPGFANVEGRDLVVYQEKDSHKFVVNGQAVNDKSIPALDHSGSQVGIYDLDQDGYVTFTPNPGYVGQPEPAHIQGRGINGTIAEATYSPVVNPTVITTGMQGESQSIMPDFKGEVDLKFPASFEDGVTSMTVPGQGTYTINPETGQVTFTPEPDFVGQATPITVIRRNVKFSSLKVLYIPTVYEKMILQDTSSTGYPGEKQTGTPVFEGDVDLTIPATFENGQTELTVPGEGTYVLNPDGSVTFTPEAGFLGQASGVTVVRVDRNGRKVTAQYVPTVVPVPVAPSEPEVQTQGLLPATGEAPDYSFFSGVALTILASVGLVATRKRQATDED